MWSAFRQYSKHLIQVLGQGVKVYRRTSVGTTALGEPSYAWNTLANTVMMIYAKGNPLLDIVGGGEFEEGKETFLAPYDAGISFTDRVELDEDMWEVISCLPVRISGKAVYRKVILRRVHNE